MIRPLSITTMSSARASASSMYCVVSSTVVPPCERPRTISHKSLRRAGSRPVVGSSRNSILGLPTSEVARSSRRRMPPEYCLAGLRASCSRPKVTSSSSARLLACLVGMSSSRPIM